MPRMANLCISARRLACLLCVLLFLGAGLSPAVDWEKVPITMHPITESLYMLEGRGGNMGIFAGEDGVFMIDDQFAPLTDRIVKEIRKISDQPIRFLINTHVHPDHVGGNENLGKLGALIFAHDNAQQRMEAGPFSVRTGEQQAPLPRTALPLISYGDGITFHINGEKVYVFPIPPAHTDGDTFVHFTGSNVLHLGDVFRTTGYPIIDVTNGGRFSGIIDGLNLAIDLADAETKIIPGHGHLATRDDLIATRDMLVTIETRIQAMLDAGEGLEQVLASKPTEEFDARWGKLPDWYTIERFIEIIFQELIE